MRRPGPADDTSSAVTRTASPSIFSSAVTSTLEPDARISRDRFSTSLKQVTSTEPAASEMRTQAMRLPVRVIRSLVATTVPAIFTRLTPAAARASTWLDCGDAEPPQRLGVGVQRMGGQMEADGLGLERQPLQRRPVGHVGQAQRLRLAGDAAEQADLAAFLFLLIGLGAAQDRFGAGEQARAVGVQAVEGAGAHEVLDLHRG